MTKSRSPMVWVAGITMAAVAVSTDAATIAEYDAGLAPTLATSPTTQGWTEAGVSGGATVGAVNDDLSSGYNGWNITDSSTTSRPRYEVLFDAATVADLATNGWELDIRGRGVGTTGTVFWGVANDAAFGGAGVARRWGIGLTITSGNLIVNWYGSSNVQVTTDGTGASAYHDIKLVGEAGSTNATLYIDGALIGTNTGQANAGTPDRIEIGATSTGGTGSNVNWNYVNLTSVPEPATAALAGLGVVLLARRRA